jgi:hypothetical protein
MSGWSIDVETCSPEQLVELSRQLEGSEHTEQLLAVRREMIARLRKAGSSNQEIVDILIIGVWKSDRNAMAEKWSPILEITEQEFKRLASG